MSITQNKMARVLVELVAGSDPNKVLPVGSIGKVVYVYPQCLEVDFGENLVWMISEKAIVEERVEIFNENIRTNSNC